MVLARTTDEAAATAETSERLTAMNRKHDWDSRLQDAMGVFAAAKELLESLQTYRNEYGLEETSGVDSVPNQITRIQRLLNNEINAVHELIQGNATGGY